MAAILALAAFAPDAAARPMDIGGPTSSPIGHFEFCKKWREECARIAEPSGPEALDEAAWAAVRRINDRINSEIAPKTDRELFGKEELWTFPKIAGDCEDFALLKRRILIEEQGLSPSNVLLTVVKRQSGEGHAILTLRTTEGDFVLDNLHPAVRSWEAAKGYKFVKRQSSENAAAWVAIGDPGPAPVLSAGSKP
ncbi:transglutaminase-like cysteine peptidase [Mesorhizobium sp. WSM2239]|uniref:Transglutaminase-like cysteine peptidase n=2 Tax=unclassified Mesorhizobium TaxID=325217 RepID=A0AAU8DAA3_9HYPH